MSESSDTDSAREGEPFICDDNCNVVFPREVRRRSRTNHFLITLNNTDFVAKHRRGGGHPLRAGFDAWVDACRDDDGTVLDACWHCCCGVFVVLVTARIIHYHLLVLNLV